MDKNSRIYVSGHQGLVGQALVRRLRNEGFSQLILADHAELDLTDHEATEAFFAARRPEYVISAAGKVGGILANKTYPVDFLQENILIHTSLLRAAQRHGVSKVLLLGSSCIYPRLAPQPIKEESLLTGPLETTNQCYAIAKISALMLGQAYREQYGLNVISAMPTNLYGPGDNFDLDNSHVLPAMLRKCHEAKAGGAKSVTLWGSGAPLREFLHVDDLGKACLFLMEHYEAPEVINVGSGQEISIRDLAGLVAEVVDFDGEIIWDTSKPDGTPRKLLDISKISSLGWRSQIALREGLAETYRWFLSQPESRIRGLVK
jgi:GDP-L-fucose synthase